jgi:flagella basal body P-ring formation protein FlgA
MIAVIGLALAISAAPQCIPLEKEHVTGADLARANPLFAPVPASRIIGYSPAPGRQRMFSVPELKAIADSAGVSNIPAQEICFEWQTARVVPEEAARAMKQSFPEATIEIVELSQYPAPLGDVVFPRTGLQRLPAAAMLWRGYVSYAEGRKFDIWARVRITVETDRVVATELLRAGHLIREDQVRIERYSGPPLEPVFAGLTSEVVGRVARALVLAGSPVKTANLELPPEINRGDMVNVQVLSGAARISLDARANSTARKGESVQLQNQTSGKIFRATVSGTGRAVVVLGGMK